MAAFSQCLLWDKRGQGLSARIEGVPTLEERVDDLRAVMDAVGWDRAALSGASEGGLMSIMFAALHPERVSHLVLVGTAARFSWAPDYPHWGPTDLAALFIEEWVKRWGTPESPSVRLFAQSRLGDAAFLKWMNRLERGCSTPRAFAETMRLNAGLDVRVVACQIQAPTLVMHYRGDPLVPIVHGRWLADHIPGARFVELDGSDHAEVFGQDLDHALDETETFLTGTVAAAEIDRVLSTVLFTDLVGSTERVAAMGDKPWKGLLDRFDAITGRVVDRHRGRLVNHTGDGHLATFDGPARAIRCAQELGTTVKSELGIDVRAGLHTGEVELRGDDVSGIAVHLAARVASLATAGQVLVSRTVTDLVAGSGLRFADSGVHTLKGVPGEWQLFEVAA
jgi:class 3 adenylate cyclase